MPIKTNPRTGLSKGKIASASPHAVAPLVELLITIAVPDGQIEGQTAVDPQNMVGPPAPNRNFAVEYISIFSRVPTGQQAHSMVNTDYGGQWFALFPQGTFDGYDVYVCSQATNFTIPPTGDRFFAMTRSLPDGAANALIHFTGYFF